MDPITYMILASMAMLVICIGTSMPIFVARKYLNKSQLFNLVRGCLIFIGILLFLYAYVVLLMTTAIDHGLPQTQDTEIVEKGG